jgi:transcription elongation factor Elf1
MTVKYKYECSFCDAKYLEQRPVEQPQLILDCQVCGAGIYEEVSVEIISAPVEEPTV